MPLKFHSVYKRHWQCIGKRIGSLTNMFTKVPMFQIFCSKSHQLPATFINNKQTCPERSTIFACFNSRTGIYVAPVTHLLAGHRYHLSYIQQRVRPPSAAWVPWQLRLLLLPPTYATHAQTVFYAVHSKDRDKLFNC